MAFTLKSRKNGRGEVEHSSGGSQCEDLESYMPSAGIHTGRTSQVITDPLLSSRGGDPNISHYDDDPKIHALPHSKGSGAWLFGGSATQHSAAAFLLPLNNQQSFKNQHESEPTRKSQEPGLFNTSRGLLEIIPPGSEVSYVNPLASRSREAPAAGLARKGSCSMWPVLTILMLLGSLLLNGLLFSSTRHLKHKLDLTTNALRTAQTQAVQLQEAITGLHTRIGQQSSSWETEKQKMQTDLNTVRSQVADALARADKAENALQTCKNIIKAGDGTLNKLREDAAKLELEIKDLTNLSNAATKV